MVSGVPAARPSLVERYRPFLPIGATTRVVSLGEGSTPLVHAQRLGAQLGLANLYLKIEGMNPTGSFKDRGMVVAVAKALEDGARSVICASTGNTSASAAAYAAAAGLGGVVVLPRGAIALGKLLQALVAGARVVAVDGSFDDALRIVRALAEQDDHPVTLVNSVNPARLEGQKTGAFEVCDDLGRAPDVLAIPVGNAGNISAYWQGFREYEAAGIVAATPADVGLPGGRCGATGAGPAGGAPRDDRDRDPDRQAGVVDEGGRRPRRVGWPDRRGHGRGDPRCVSRSGADRGGVLRAVLGGVDGGSRRPQGPASSGSDAVVVAVLTGSGLRDPTAAERIVSEAYNGDDRRRRGRARLVSRLRRSGGCRRYRRRVRSRRARGTARFSVMTLYADVVARRGTAGGRAAVVTHWLAELDGRRLVVEVPASSANLGAGYDCLGLALDLQDRVEVEVRGWSRGKIELTVHGEGADELPDDRENRFVQGLEAALVEAAARSRGRRLADRDAQRDPARARPRLVGGGHGRRAGRRQRAGR